MIGDLHHFVNHHESGALVMPGSVFNGVGAVIESSIH